MNRASFKCYNIDWYNRAEGCYNTNIANFCNSVQVLFIIKYLPLCAWTTVKPDCILLSTRVSPEAARYPACGQGRQVAAART